MKESVSQSRVSPRSLPVLCLVGGNVRPEMSSSFFFFFFAAPTSTVFSPLSMNVILQYAETGARDRGSLRLCVIAKRPPLVVLMMKVILSYLILSVERVDPPSPLPWRSVSRSLETLARWTLLTLYSIPQCLARLRARRVRNLDWGIEEKLGA